MNKQQIQKLTRMAMLTAVAVVMAALVHFPLFPAASFLEYDPADAVILIAAFLYGPWDGVLVTVVVSIIQGTTVSAGSGVIGIIMHILATSSFCLVSGYLYKKNHTTVGLALSLVLGALAMALVMVGCNLVFTPLYTGMPMSEVAKMIPGIILPFNLLKAGINAAVTFLLYPPLKKALEKF
ncbi:MAG: ECF transporter S component [Oscillospiraceae bacterium]|nr:ECF transporter S component [Oscillospiraceae bacterium]